MTGRTETPGLRARKRLQTRDRIEHAAVSIALSDGIDRATIEAISAAADISPRTFFNYFGCKEDAILGSPEVLSDGWLADFHALADDDLIDAISEMVLRLVVSSSDEGLRRTRLGIAHRYPQLVYRQFARLNNHVEPLVQAVADVLDRGVLARGVLARGVLAQTERAVAGSIVALCGMGVAGAIAASDEDRDSASLRFSSTHITRLALEALQ